METVAHVIMSVLALAFLAFMLLSPWWDEGFSAAFTFLCWIMVIASAATYSDGGMPAGGFIFFAAFAVFYTLYSFGVYCFQWGWPFKRRKPFVMVKKQR